jgi:hypothetical protein
MPRRFDKFIQRSDGIIVVSRTAPTTVRKDTPSAAALKQRSWGPALTAGECAAVVEKIRPQFEPVARRFDSGKYPQDVYERVLAAFAKPKRVTPAALRDALLWKYGHLRKAGKIPGAHRRLIAAAQRAWPRLAPEIPSDPEQAFALIDSRLGGPTRFISVTFLVHLVSQGRVPIIDQHNFRAVNSLAGEVRSIWHTRRKPSRWADVVLVAAFMEGITVAWRQQDPASVPTLRRLDQFLMRYGKDVKARQSLAVKAAGATINGRG